METGEKIPVCIGTLLRIVRILAYMTYSIPQQEHKTSGFYKGNTTTSKVTDAEGWGPLSM